MPNTESVFITGVEALFVFPGNNINMSYMEPFISAKGNVSCESTEASAYVLSKVTWGAEVMHQIAEKPDQL